MNVKKKNITPSAFKLNLGYFKMYDDLENNSGSVALNNIIKMISSFGDIPVILDVKDADIARSSAAFAISHLKIEEIDAITVNPYLGTDSVEPFFQLASDLNKVVYILTRTTNDGAVDFQERTLANSRSNISENIINNDCELYLAVANKLIEWSRSYEGVVGSVVAGNYTNELRKVARLFVEKNADIPLLIPGIGTQGGDAQSVMQVLDEVGYDHRLARISSSSGVMYRGQKENLPQSRHSEVSAEEVERLNHEIELSSYI